MFHTLLGETGFQAALRDYFQQFDGLAITCDDFLACMATQYQKQYSGQNLAAFAGWYEQAGTPLVSVRLDYDANQQTATLHLSQTNPPVGIELLEKPIPEKKTITYSF